MKFIVTQVSAEVEKDAGSQGFGIKGVNASITLYLQSSGDMSEIWSLDKNEAAAFLSKRILETIPKIEINASPTN